LSEEEIKEVKEESEASRHNEQLLRLKADFENVKKRLEREKLEAIKYANERLLGEVLPIMDNLDRALASLSEGHDPEKVKTGLKLAQSELHQVLEQHGVQTVKALGEAFDPRFHEAMGIVESQDEEDGTILEEVQRGYLLNGRLIRPSRVRVSQKNK
jgi:molecular chaperone GrpE